MRIKNDKQKSPRDTNEFKQTIVYKYHWIRQVIWAFEALRKEEQKKFSKSYRRYFKRSGKLLIKRFENLSDEEKQQVNILLYASANLSRAYFYKNRFLEILSCKDRESAKKNCPVG